MAYLSNPKQNSTLKNILNDNKFKAKSTYSDLAEALFLNAPTEDFSLIKIKRLSQGLSSAMQGLNAYKKGEHQIEIIDTLDEKQKVTGHVLQLLGDNKPFLFDSIMGALLQHELNLQLVLHPVFNIECNEAGKFNAISKDQSRDHQAKNIQRISLMQFYTEKLLPSEQEAILAQLEGVLESVYHAVEDWQSMLLRLDEMIEEYHSQPPKISKQNLEESIAFLNWLRDENFTFLGMREYVFSGDKKTGVLKRSRRKGLGILQNPNLRILTRNGKAVTITPAIREFLLSKDPLFVSKANVKSVVHRQTYMDYVGIKRYDEKGNLVGELRILGLFTSSAYTRSVNSIPLLRRKVSQVLSKFGFDEDSHSGKALINVLESYPRDDFFQIDVPTLSRFSQSILALGEHPRVRMLSRVDRFDRYVSVLAFIPRDRYSSKIREKIGSMLKDEFNGRLSAYYPSFPEGSLARVHYIIGRSEGESPKVKDKELEAKVSSLIETWEDHFRKLIKSKATDVNFALLEKAVNSFDEDYRSQFEPQQAIDDLEAIAGLKNDDQIAIKFHKPFIGRSKNDPSRIALKLFHPSKPAELSKRVPLLEDMGFNVINERTFRINPSDGRLVFMHEMLLSSKDGSAIKIENLQENLEQGFFAAWYGEAESDGFNALMLLCNLTWQEVAILRALSRYLRQVQLPYTNGYIWKTLNRNPEFAKLLISYFHKKFDPKLNKNLDQKNTKSNAGLKAIEKKFETVLAKIVSLDDDRILRAFIEVIQGVLRVNFYQKSEHKFGTRTWGFKINPQAISFMPDPKPFREIFIYSPRVEGTHLRFGSVARGGLRWSDRAQDYRTEVLGLVKAQQVKNAVIVPVGSKGGFYPARLPKIIAAGGDRDAIFNEGRTAYQIYISSLLSLTDNLVENEVVPPENTVRFDEADPYFVVAADKGTATFSDTANKISSDHGYWLDDAFASGGSAGYDHKVMGITARGGWEAVKRHFREINHDIQTKPFTVVGVGDMSGDVFGNGMLLSKKTRLIAAFDHRDIFIDPNPDESASFKERQRMFKVPRSSWQDYDKKLISKGGGVFSRQKKSIELSLEATKAIGLEKQKATPNEIIIAILKSKVDLLWFGGIGTYIRASFENNNDVGDRGNDAIRITAAQVGAKSIGEGANLGLTQNARIEFNKLGGRCNSDAIDNSAGVNSSDVEVNIKIALAFAVRSGKLTMAERNKLLRSMTKEVAQLVLKNNYNQTLALSLIEKKGFLDFAYQKRFMLALESQGLLDRGVELLPDDATLLDHEQTSTPLLRAELAVLLAYAKITLQDRLVASDVPDDPYLEKQLFDYFPTQMQKKFSKEIKSHRLRREIISTELANEMINRCGATYLIQTSDQVGATSAETARVFLAVRDGFGLQKIFSEIDALDNKIDGQLQLALYARVQDLLLDQSLWLLRNGNSSLDLKEVVANHQKSIKTLSDNIVSKLPEHMASLIKDEFDAYVAAGVPKALATKISSFTAIARIPDIGHVAAQTGADLNAAAEAYFTVTETFKIGRMKSLADEILTHDYYDDLALRRALQILNDARLAITVNLLSQKKVKSLKGVKAAQTLIKNWESSKAKQISRMQQAVDAIIESDTLSVSRLTVAANLLTDFVKE